jgi:phosphoribosylglycinamide formyltransferase 1
VSLNARDARDRPASLPLSSLRIAVFASGGGSNLRALYQRTLASDFPAQIALVISNNSQSGALQFSREHGLEAHHLSNKHFASHLQPEAALGEALLRLLKEKHVGLIVLAGYMKLVPGSVVSEYRNRIVNVHPALLPAFSGPAMYGDRVHEAVLARGCKISGATVHFVDEEYDRGPIILQEACEVTHADTLESLKLRVQAIEHALLPKAVELIAKEKVSVVNHIVHIAS